LQEVDDNIHKELANILRQALSCDKKIFPDDLRLLRSRKLFPLGSFITYGKFICMETTDCKIPGNLYAEMLCSNIFTMAVVLRNTTQNTSFIRTESCYHQNHASCYTKTQFLIVV
jgi:hypothetical protein